MKNFALVGCGAIAGIHAAAIKEIEGAKLYGVFDSYRAGAEKFAAENGCAIFDSLEKLLADRSVDIVNICTPSGLHAPIAVAAAKAGKHVIVEKPMAITKEQIDDIATAAKKNDVKIAVITQLRFTPAVRKLKEAIDGGRLGKLLFADFRMKYYRCPEYYSSSSWRGTKAMDGGGALMNQGIHGIDLMQYLMGRVKSVYADCRTLLHDIEAEDTANLLVEYDCGAIGVIQGTTAAAPGYPRTIEISGTKGTVILEEDSIKQWDVQGECEECSQSDVNSASNPLAIGTQYHKLQFEDLIRAIDTNTEPLVGVDEGRKPVEIILAAYESSEKGVKIKL